MDAMKKVSAIALALLLSTTAAAYAQEGERRGGRDRESEGSLAERDSEPRGMPPGGSRPGIARQPQAQPQ